MWTKNRIVLTRQLLVKDDNYLKINKNIFHIRRISKYVVEYLFCVDVSTPV